MKFIFKIVAIATISFASFNGTCSDRIISVNELPQVSRDFIQKHFADDKVSYAKIDDGKYEVRLASGAEIDFCRDGEWDKVDCKFAAVPEEILNQVPAGITEYVTANFPGAVIVKVDKERFRIEVELDNDLDLEFSKNGKFLKIDD